MENAAKALTIAGAILITLMVISAFVFAYRDIAGVKSQEADNQQVQAIAEFNKSYESFEKELYGAELLSLANKMWDYNQRVGGKDGYDEMSLSVTIKGEGTKYIDDFRDIIDRENELMDIYISSNYLEGLYDAKHSTDPSASYQIEQILKKIGKTSIPNSLVTRDYPEHLKYKELKVKRFNCTGTSYSKNGRIQSMTFAEK